jgi:4-amino-4-deoxy-L-arabinose transferase-like glycosyltransferase
LAGVPEDTVMPSAGAGARAGRVIAALFLFALVVRVGAALRTAAIFNDGPTFIEIAAQMWQGDWAAAFAHQYHPLYPLLTAGAYALLGDLEHAALAVSLVAGALAVVALYLFLRRAFDETTARIGGVLLALHPYSVAFSSDVQSEGLYLALFLSAIAALWCAIELRSTPYAGLAGGFAGLAYLVRPEGLGVVGVGGLVALMLVGTRRWSLAPGVRWCAALVLGALLFAGPYVVHLHDLSGEWMLTQKKSFRDLTAPGDEEIDLRPGVPNRQRFMPPGARRPGARDAALLPAALYHAVPALLSPPPARVQLESPELDALFTLVVVAGGALHVTFALLLCFGLYLARGRPGERGVFLAVLVAVYAVVLYGLALNVGYVSRRHVLVPLLPLFGYAALAVPAIGHALLRFLGRGIDMPERRVIGLSLVVIAALTLPKTWSAHREERLATRLAAEWLADEGDLVGPVAARKYRDAYYARQAFIDFSRGGPEVEPVLLRRAGARFLIVDDHELERLPSLRAAGVRELHRVEAAGRVGYVYEFVDPVGR